MRNQNAGARQYPSEYQVREIGSRGLPTPPTYDKTQARLDSFEPPPAQQKRLNELGLTAETRGEVKLVIAGYVAQNHPRDHPLRPDAGRRARPAQRGGDAGAAGRA